MQESLKRDGLSYDIIGNGDESYEGIEIKISNVIKDGEQSYGTISVDAGGIDTLERTMFSTISNDDELDERLIKIIEDTVAKIKKSSSKAVPWELD